MIITCENCKKRFIFENHKGFWLHNNYIEHIFECPFCRIPIIYHTDIPPLKNKEKQEEKKDK